MDNMFVLKNIQKTYTAGSSDKPSLVVDKDFSIPKEKIVAIAGYSGSGKSTLLNVLGMLDYPDFNFESRMEVMGSPVEFCPKMKRWKFENRNMDFKSFRRENLGFVFQHTFLPRSLRVYQAFMFSDSISNLHPEEPKIIEALCNVGLKKWVKKDGLAEKRVNELSGGQLQRVAIAVAMSKKPKIILADEPTSSLDFTSGGEVLSLFRDWVQEGGTLVWVSHNLYQLARFADIIHMMVDGRIVMTIDNEEKPDTEEDISNLVETMAGFLANDKE